MTTTHAAPAAPTAPKKSGGYIVFRQEDGAWQQVNTSSEKSAGAAIRGVVAKLAVSDQSGSFVAIPARSWQPVKVTAKTETKLVVEAAS